MTRLGLFLALIILGTALPLTSQVARFEVASIKPAAKDIALPGPSAPDRFYRRSISLLDLINYAFDMRAFRIFGADGWPSTEQWDISAKADRPLNLAEMRTMVQQLMADRFALKIRRETRDLPIYHMVVARDDKRLGPQMKPAAVDCEPFRSGQRPMQEAPRDENGFPRCGTRFSIGAGIRTARYDGTPTGRLAAFLQTDVNRAVVDKTGLTGSFDIELTFADEQFVLPPGATRREGVSVFTALQEQLGLKLESARGPVEVLVVDSAQRPTPD
jgi:uncharacterized protein (TIGR03435 family)